MHTIAEQDDMLQQTLARDPDRLAACHETLIARKRWVQYLDAAGSLSGQIVRIIIGEPHPWSTCHVDRIERSMNVVSECFVIVTGAGLRIPISPHTKLFVEKRGD